MPRDIRGIPIEALVQDPDIIDIIVPYNRQVAKYFADVNYVQLGKKAGNYVVAYLYQEDLPVLAKEIGGSEFNLLPLAMGLMERHDLEAAGIIQVQNQPYLDLRGNGVLLGFVDTGIDYTLPAFQYEDGTSKVLSLWDQSISGDAPEGYFYGTEYSHQQINEALQSAQPYSVVPSRDTVGHGTFLASVAGSHEDSAYIGAAPDADIIAVKLKKASPYYLDYYLVPPEQESVFESSDLMLGIQFILERALALGRPVAIAVGVGTNFGTHDGLGTLEAYVTSVAHLDGVAICTAAGNESNMRHHASGIISQSGASDTLELRSAGPESNIFLSLWNSASDRFSISVTSPAGETVGRIPFKAGLQAESKLVLEKSIVQVSYIFPTQGTGEQLTIVRLMEPTPGIWKVAIYGDNIVNGTYHAWLPITDMVAPGVEFLAPDPYYTVLSPATAIGSVSCGAYNSLNNSLYVSSSWGPTRLPGQVPVLVAPGVNVGGLLPGNQQAAMSGTSVSAAITAGACALMLEWGVVQGNNLPMNSFLLRSYLIKGCTRDEGKHYPDSQWGYGKLNLINTFEQMSLQ